MEAYGEENIYDLSELFKVFGDYSRLRILIRLFESPQPVGELAEGLSMTQSAVSHQLSILKKAKLIAGRRSGRQIIYSLSDDHVRRIIAQGMEHVME